MKTIPVGNLFALVDDDDFEKVSHYNWRLHKDGYAVTTVGKKGYRKSLYMHRLVKGNPPGLIVDHVKDERLDNRKSKLRVGTHSQNHGNSNFKPGLSSQFKGVAWHTSANKWRARIGGGRHKNDVHLGLFISETDAALAYDRAALAHFGEFARLNFPRQNRTTCEVLAGISASEVVDKVKTALAIQRS